MQHGLQNGTETAWKELDEGDVYKANWDHAMKSNDYDTAYKAAGAVHGSSWTPGGSSATSTPPGPR